MCLILDLSPAAALKQVVDLGKTSTMQIIVPDGWTPDTKLTAKLPSGVKVTVKLPADTAVGDTLEFEIPANLSRDPTDEENPSPEDSMAGAGKSQNDDSRFSAESGHRTSTRFSRQTSTRCIQVDGTLRTDRI